MANETNQGQQTGGQQQGQKQNPSTGQPSEKKPNQIGDQKYQDSDKDRQAPGREQEQGGQPTQRRSPGNESDEKEGEGQERKRA